MRRPWVIVSLALALLTGGLLHQIGAQAGASLKREYQFNDVYRLASHSTVDYFRAELMFRTLDEVNRQLQDELNTRPLGWGRPHRTF